MPLEMSYMLCHIFDALESGTDIFGYSSTQALMDLFLKRAVICTLFNLLIQHEELVVRRPVTSTNLIYQFTSGLAHTSAAKLLIYGRQ